MDCGLFQGLKLRRRRNWQRFPVDPASLGAVLLTHAHIDHSGWLPALVRNGFRGPVYATAGTTDLFRIMLPDSARIQEEDARYAERKGFSRHDPPRPLYTEADAAAALELFVPVPLSEYVTVGKLRAGFRRAGHILGAASVELDAEGRTLLFSGDLGRDDDFFMRPPEPPGEPDCVVMESTYGDRNHTDEDPIEVIAETIRPTIERGGTVLLAAFAVGRVQSLLYALHELFATGRLPRVPVFVDSPMATNVTRLYEAHVDELRLSRNQCAKVCAVARFVRTVDESKTLDAPGPARIIIAASGMLAGGRVLHHLAAHAPNRRNLIVLPGFQAPGSRGAALAAGASEVKVHGTWVPVAAEVAHLHILSAHADQRGLLAWLGRCNQKPSRVFLVHGEPDAQDALRVRIQEELGLKANSAEHGDTVSL